MNNPHAEIWLIYAKILPVKSAVFSSELVYFYRSGFNHLIRKGRKFRSKKDISRRAAPLPFVGLVLLEGRIDSFRMSGRVNFWRIKRSMGSLDIVVIVRQFSNQKKHFFSVFSQKRVTKKSPRTEIL